MGKIQKRIIIKGKVQGVGFRYAAEKYINEYHFGVKGYVRNLQNGDVEVLIHGDELRLQTIIEWLKQGPPRARVDSIRVMDEPLNDDSGYFEIR